MKKKLPIGIEDFEKLRIEDFYYVDKTGFIRDLLQNWSEVNLFTRPRRFGKSLNMSMLKYFFEPGMDSGIFDGLEIAKEKELCKKYMGKFPVIFISLKGIDGNSYEGAYGLAVRTVTAEARNFQYLLDSEQLTEQDKELFLELMKNDMDEPAFCDSLKTLSNLLHKHYNQKVILLIDEYDVPLQKAYDQGYYDPMIKLIRNFLGQALKTNPSLQFAVLTGCLRISKESIFTGLNNLRVLSIADMQFDEYFGFTDQEVRELLDYYGFSGSYNVVKDWYDGYQFGNVKVYCPWDVINYCYDLRADENARTQNYWLNTSGNDVVRRFIREADAGLAKKEIENLVAGKAITKEIRRELTYRDMYDSIDNIWSILYFAGYLTGRENPEGDDFYLAIPNMEIRQIFTRQIMELFKENIKKDGAVLKGFCEAVQNGDAKEVEKRFEDYLKDTITIRDTFVRVKLKENFYHGILLGILGFMGNWSVSSNKETGEGYSDIVLESDDGENGIIMEVKYAQNGNLEKESQKALEQIERNNYEEVLKDDGIENIIKYGIACYKNHCCVKKA